MREFHFESTVWLPRPLEEVFAFFAAPQNLEAITPPWLKFQILTQEPIIMRPGVLIDYRIQVRGIPLKWRTRIDDWRPPHCFVDVQLRGPYKLWHHTHRFEERDGGTLCGDQIRYCPIGGALTHFLFVRRDVERIFRHRSQRLAELFPGRPEPSHGGHLQVRS